MSSRTDVALLMNGKGSLRRCTKRPPKQEAAGSSPLGAPKIAAGQQTSQWSTVDHVGRVLGRACQIRASSVPLGCIAWRVEPFACELVDGVSDGLLLLSGRVQVDQGSSCRAVTRAVHQLAKLHGRPGSQVVSRMAKIMKVDPGTAGGGKRWQPVAAPEVGVAQREAGRPLEDQGLIIRGSESRQVPGKVIDR
jgi:hypothetical protein